MPARTLDLVGLAEAAELLGLQRATISSQRMREPGRNERRPPFPRPAAELRCGPIWRRRQILDYKVELERLEKMTFFEWLEWRKRASRARSRTDRVRSARPRAVGR